MSCKAGSMSALASSGSSPSINAVEPLRSANSAVIVLRSPSILPRASSAACSARMRSARRRGYNEWSLIYSLLIFQEVRRFEMEQAAEFLGAGGQTTEADAAHRRRVVGQDRHRDLHTGPVPAFVAQLSGP